jgi:MFS family permease
MSLFIVGGAALQWPMGRLSDRHDRRFMLVLVGVIGAMAAALLPMASGHAWLAYTLLFVFGGMAFALYPIAVAHLLDYVPGEELLAASSSVLLVNGIGAAIGPLLAGLVMTRLGPAWLFAWCAACMAAAAVFIGLRLKVMRRVQEDTPSFQPMLRTSPAAMEMHPVMDDVESEAVHAGER